MKLTKVIKIGGMQLGGDEPVRVQSMLNFDIADIDRTLAKIEALKSSGCEMIRVAVHDDNSLSALEVICRKKIMPVIADIHFNADIALAALDYADKLRINPSNIKDDKKLIKIIHKAREMTTPIRIGVNTGSISASQREKHDNIIINSTELLKEQIHLFEKHNYFQIVLSIKSSNPKELIVINRKLAETWDYPLHIGLTEAGPGISGIVKSSFAIGAILSEGIGNTIRVSLTGDPLDEVKAAWEILKATGIRNRGVKLIACPECGRTCFDVHKASKMLHSDFEQIETPLQIALMGCIVNGPGEALNADYALVGTENGILYYEKGKLLKRKLEFNEALQTLIKALEEIS